MLAKINQNAIYVAKRCDAVRCLFARRCHVLYQIKYLNGIIIIYSERHISNLITQNNECGVNVSAGKYFTWFLSISHYRSNIISAQRNRLFYHCCEYKCRSYWHIYLKLYAVKAMGDQYCLMYYFFFVTPFTETSSNLIL